MRIIMGPVAAIIVCLWIFSGPSAIAETHYVTDQISITLRSGPAMDRKIVAMLPTGTPLEVLEAEDDWSHVRLPSGKEGWVLTRFVKTGLPVREQMAQLEEKYQTLVTQDGQPAKEIERLTDENKQLKTAMSENAQALTALQAEYDQLRAETADVSESIRQKDQCLKDKALMTHRMNRLESDLRRQNRQANMWWFLSGAGVLVMGVVIGSLLSGRRRRPSLY